MDRPHEQFNVYRDFYVRDEGVVFHRLALRVTDGKLTDIYLQKRTSIEFEAHTLVEEVGINNVRRSVNKPDEKNIARPKLK